jgi:site-specific DNA recombinase
VDEERMRVVRRVVGMAADGTPVHGIKRMLDTERVPTPTGGPYWHCGAIESFITDDVYKPHTFDEIAELVSPQVAAGLDPDKLYGVWWYNRKRVKRTQVSEVGADGRIYRKRRRYETKNRAEWIAVPVPDAGISLEVVNTARGNLGTYKRSSKAAGRFWELSGAIARCSECGRAMVPRPVTYKLKSGGTSTINYYRCSKAYGYSGRCSHTSNYRAEDLEGQVWDLIVSLLRDPDRLRAASTGYSKMSARPTKATPSERRGRG